MFGNCSHQQYDVARAWGIGFGVSNFTIVQQHHDLRVDTINNNINSNNQCINSNNYNYNYINSYNYNYINSNNSINNSNNNSNKMSSTVIFFSYIMSI
jgi:hypothetical protein